MNTTKTAQFTQGPLKAVQIIIENSPCTWAVQRKSLREQWGKPSVATYIDNEADARLFAAAPDMYVELMKQRDWLLHIKGQIQAPNSILLGFDQSIKYINRVLAQAEGRQA